MLLFKMRYRPSRVRLAGIMAALAFASIGAFMLSPGQAATYVANVEAEGGTLGGPAVKIANAQASAGEAVRFDASSPGGSSGCSYQSVAAPCIGDASTGASGWGAPAFEDQFNGTSLDTAKWSPCWFTPTCGTQNNVSTDPTNVSVSGGNVILTLKDLNSGASISTNPEGGANPGFEFTTGYAEARVYFPGNGTDVYNWPAWWITGQNHPYDGENDIAEGLGTMTVNYHSPSGAHNQGTVPGIWTNDYHIYGIYRQRFKSDVYYDGKLVKSYTTDDSGNPQYPVINVGQSNSRTKVYGQASQVKVDYVRVWRK